MSVAYSLELATSLTKRQAYYLLAKRFEAQVTPDGMFAHRDNLLITGWDVPPGDTHAEIYEEAFHFTPTLSLGFPWPKESDYEQFYRLMLRASMLMLEHAADSVLRLDTLTVFQRIGGKLIFNTARDVWWEGKEKLIQEEVHVPYVLQVLPQLL